MPEIVVKHLQTEIKPGKQSYAEEILIGEIADLKIEHTIHRGPIKQSIDISSGAITIFIILRGKGILHAHSRQTNLTAESIAIPMRHNGPVQIEVPSDEQLSFLIFTKTLSTQDIEDLCQFPDDNKYDLYFKRFVDCEPYTEKIKSPNTVSRTVLPADIVPRVSLGTVEAKGPDAVGAHSHPMLEQLFLGLSENDMTVFADQACTECKADSLLHIPLGSTHWVTVDEHKKMNYMWMDFFLTREGQEWLKTHKPIQQKEK